ncbi:hypothetical protein GLOIN_2v1767340 [Rhizophagus irregularis DAOM 181602=DAOM 197198]|nr:hypothetical protein GLOIN_2v1767340 [Rhizophagus irregularis DAOM 181602=DAOM 197198]
MDISKYDGNVHPDEWINDIKKYNSLWENNYGGFLKTVISLIDPTIKLSSTEINDIEKLRNELKDDISFEVFKNTNKRKLQSLKYYPERKVLEESKLIRNESIVALKHTSTGKYLSSISNLCYTTGSGKQLVFAGGVEPDPNSLWKIQFDTELATYADTFIRLQHIKSRNFLGIRYQGYQYDNTKGRGIYCYYKSPSTKHTEVICGGEETTWKFNYNKLENYRGYLKSDDIININIKRMYDENGRKNGQVEFLRSHDVQFTIGNDLFQEVVCHNERLGGNDEWCIELIHEVNIF